MRHSCDEAGFDWERPETGALLDDARALHSPGPAADAELWSRISRDTVRRRPRSAWPALAAVAAAAAAVLVALALRAPAPATQTARVVAIGSDVRLELSRNATLDVLDSPPAPRPAAAAPSTRQVVLLSGDLRAQVQKQPPGSRFAVVTPHLRVVVVGTRFSVEVQPEFSRVRVEEGRVRVETPVRSIELGAGESARSDEPRLQAVVAGMPLPARSTCDPAGADSLACNETLARGEGLAAQNALFQLGLSAEEKGDLPAALQRWQELTRRFPSAALAPEAHLASLRSLVQLRRFDEALSVAQGFEQRFPADSRSPEVLLIQAKLLCGAPGRQAAGLEALTRLQAMEAAEGLRQEALFVLGACQRSAGDESTAAQTWRHYLDVFPAGPHAAEIARSLTGN